MGLASSAYNIPFELKSGAITTGVTILSKDIKFVADEKDLIEDNTITQVVLNGNSGLIRFWFAIDTPADYELTVLKNSPSVANAFKLNGDNNFVIKDLGYYRFDLVVSPNDRFNFSTNQSITLPAAIHDLIIQQIFIGA